MTNPNRLITFWEDQDIITEVDKAAVKCGVNRSAYIRQAVRQALREAQK